MASCKLKPHVSYKQHLYHKRHQSKLQVNYSSARDVWPNNFFTESLKGPAEKKNPNGNYKKHYLKTLLSVAIVVFETLVNIQFQSTLSKYWYLVTDQHCECDMRVISNSSIKRPVP